MFLGLSRVNISPCFLTSCTVMLKHMSPLRSSYLVEFVGSVPKLKVVQPHAEIRFSRVGAYVVLMQK
uniref:Uncharacterized protein n=1 Tax=Oryza meridionalis TaxID=40149 RepID=A0A0E0D348_9ORYZ